MTTQHFDVTSVPDLSGKTALVTGSNSGIGLEAAKALATHGAHVVMACRNVEKAERAKTEILGEAPNGSVEVLVIDLADLNSVRDAAKRYLDQHERLDIHINNAGVMGSPWQLTPDGLEFQFATNHFGHFALTGLLLPAILSTPSSRVVTVSSMGHHMGHFDPDDVAGVHSHNRWINYGKTKLANLLFTFELQRRLERARGSPTIAVAAHPGWAQSNLAAGGPVMGLPAVLGRLGTLAGRFGQSTTNGALPTLYGATAPEVTGGQYFGPSGIGQQYGPPIAVGSSKRSRNGQDAERLWESSEELTGVHYEFTGASASSS